MTESHYQRITASDGGEFDAYLAHPGQDRAPAVVLLQEIFGINDNMRSTADRLATEGYLVAVPDMFWRIRPRFERPGEEALTEAMSVAGELDRGLAVADMTAVLAALRGSEHCDGRVAGIGFCLGGTLAYAFAAHSRVDGRGPDAVVPYYGSGIHEMLDVVDAITCPMLFHYGDRDPYIPADQVAAVERAFADRADVQFEHYDAGHAFSNADSPSMYDAAAADLAWDRTVRFLATHLR